MTGGALSWQPRRPDGVRDDRTLCEHCRHLGWHNATAKTPPTDTRADPRQAHGEVSVRRPHCARGYHPLPGRRMRCPGYEPR